MVELEATVLRVVDPVAEVHELGRGADVELQALEDRHDVVALEPQRPLHAARVDRAGAGPLLDRDRGHPVGPERLGAPRHPGAVDQVAGQQQLGDEDGELLAGEIVVAAGHDAQILVGMCMTVPPSITNSDPVVNDDSSLARKRTIAATSAG